MNEIKGWVMQCGMGEIADYLVECEEEKEVFEGCISGRPILQSVEIFRLKQESENIA